MRSPFVLHGHETSVHASVGIASGASGARTAGELLTHADIAMYSAKAGGKRQYAVYEPQMHARIRGKHELAAAFEHAVAREEFRVHYQPIVSLAGPRTVGFEALVRWDHPSGDCCFRARSYRSPRSAAHRRDRQHGPRESCRTAGVAAEVRGRRLARSRGQPLADRVALARASPMRFSRRWTERSLAEPADPRDHRERRNGKTRPPPSRLRTAPAPRRAPGARRFRHRLRVAEPT